MLHNQVFVLEHHTPPMEGVGYPTPADVLGGSVDRVRELSPVASIKMYTTK